MPIITVNQSSFNSGIFSPKMRGRVDFARYIGAMEDCVNAFVTPQGPVVRRNGTVFVAEVKDSDDMVRLVPFQSESDTSYMLEVGNLYVRFYTNNGQVISGMTPLEIVSPYTSTEAQQIDFKQFGSSLYIVHPNHPIHILTRVGTLEWTLTPMKLDCPPTYEDGYRPNLTVTPAATTGTGINFTASGNAFLNADVGRQILNLNGPGVAVITSFTSTTVVVCTIIENFPSTSPIAAGSWKLDLSPISELKPSVSAKGSIAQIVSTALGTSSDISTFRSSDIGRYIILNGGVLRITSLNSASNINAVILKSLNDTDESSAWRLEDETWTVSRGYPRSIGFYQERLVLGGSKASPQTVWMSEIGAFDAFGIGPDNEDAIDVDISSPTPTEITWLASSRELIVGTIGSEISLGPSATTAAISSTNLKQTTRSAFGSQPQIPLVVANELIFTQRSLRKVRSYRFDIYADGYTGEDITYFADELTASGIREIFYTQEPDSIIYATLKNGTVLAGTYVKIQEVQGWTRYTTDGEIEQWKSIPVGEQDQVWCVVKRTINGQTKRYIEYLDFGDGTDNTTSFSDSSLSYSDPLAIDSITNTNPGVVTTVSAHGLSNGNKIKIIGAEGMTEINFKTYTVANATTTTFELEGINTTGYGAYTGGGNVHLLVTSLSGLDHLEGKTVQVKTDGAFHPDRVVESGSIDLEYPAYEVVVGLPYETSITTLRKEFNIGAGSMQGQRVRYPRPIIRVYQSTKPLINNQYLPARSSSDHMDEKVPLFSGDLYYGPQSWGNTGQLTISVNSPFPLILLGIYSTTDSGIL